MKKPTTRKIVDVKKMVVLAMFCAIAYLLMFVLHFKVQFLTLDIKDAVLVIASFIYGPAAGAVCALAVALLEMITVSDTGIYGFIMNFAGSAVFVLMAGLIYKYRRTMAGAAVALSVGCVSTTAVMLVLNLLITPVYQGVPLDVVVQMLLPLLLPFNAAKSVLNAAAALMLYKPVSSLLKSTRLLGAREDSTPPSAKSAAVSVIAALIIIGCIAFLLFFMSGKFALVD